MRFDWSTHCGLINPFDLGSLLPSLSGERGKGEKEGDEKGQAERYRGGEKDEQSKYR